MIDIVRATTPDQLDDVRALMRAFVGWHRRRHTEDIALIDQYFDADEFEQELAGLPGLYAPPKGCQLLACTGGEAAGCVALRDLGDNIWEMKRMFIYEHLRGRGIGRALVNRILKQAARVMSGCASTPACGRLKPSVCTKARDSNASSRTTHCPTT